MHFDYDIVIAGAGPAGSAAAYDLANAGKRVLLLDRRTFPRPKACACGLTRKTLKALRYSVDPVIERICNEIVLQRLGNKSRNEFASSQRTIAPTRSAEVRIRSRNPICAMAVRERFDDFCLQQTLAAGAQLRKIETIAALREFPTHIELDIVTASGPETLRAPVLIGADGSNGQTRRLEHLLRGRGEALSPSAQEWYTHGFALEALIPYTALPAQLPAGDAPHDLVFDFSPIPGGYGWLFPKGDHINIGVGAFAPNETRGDPSSTTAPSSSKVGSTDASLKQVTRTLLAAFTHQKLGVALPKEVTGQHLGMGGHLYIPRGCVLLTGDAAGLVDPLTGEGIHSAIISGQAAAAAILKTLAPNLSSRPEAAHLAAEAERPIFAGPRLSQRAYARHLAPLQQTLAFSHRAARAFYAEPERGFRAMRLPFLRSLILKTYADGLPHTRLLTALAKLV